MAQNDTIVASNGDVILGEIKSMQKGVLKVKTSYSSSDLLLKWLKIHRISSNREFIVSVTDGTIYNGQIKSASNDSLTVYNKKRLLVNVPINKVVYLRTLKTSFKDKLSASLALGYNFTKSENLNQFSLRSTIAYRARKWTLEGSYNGIQSTRDNVEDVRRTNASLGYNYFLQNDWYPLAEVNWLSNTEQNIKLRTVTRLGVGKYFKRTNRMYIGVQAGASYNNESFTTERVSSQNSLEGFIGSELNLYDIGDLSLLSRVVMYPSVTESGRLRIDGTIDLKYDLPLDFFIKMGFTINYDNKAIIEANKYDYVFQTSFGWEL